MVAGKGNQVTWSVESSFIITRGGGLGIGNLRKKKSGLTDKMVLGIDLNLQIYGITVIVNVKGYLVCWLENFFGNLKLPDNADQRKGDGRSLLSNV